jgi:uncharacterized membrane protein
MRYGQRHVRGSLQDQQEQQLANFLGWFSIGLGAIEVLAPRQLAHAIGVRDASVLPLFGLREIASGIGILTNERPAGWLWGRVAGDMMDLSYLAAEHLSGRGEPMKIAVAVAAVAGVTVLDIIAAEQHSERPKAKVDRLLGDGSIHVRKSITVNRSAEDLYQRWRNFENFPTFMRHLKSVEVLDERRSHWIAYSPTGLSVSWDAEIGEDRPNRFLAWNTTSGSGVAHTGSVSFLPAPGDRGTEITVELSYRPTGGVLAATLANIFSSEAPEFQIQEDLRKFKQMMEAGEVATTEGQPTGRGRSWIPGL